ncbi:50S ribosomal protein L34e [Candidatus Woesearchaeota archaeon]|nr:50S ribosomal protein L34e [Candidatus Woesearchaeota archaeon]
MVEGKHRSRSLRRVFVKTPGGTNKIQYKLRKPSKAKCVCGAELQGVPRKTTRQMKNTPKSKKRPQRAFGGTLCSRCTRKKIIENSR